MSWIKVCLYCKRILGLRILNSQKTHGICDDCLNKFRIRKKYPLKMKGEKA